MTVYLLVQEASLEQEKWQRQKDKAKASDIALDGRLSKQVERPVDRAEVLRDLQARGAELDGTEVDESGIEKLWREWTTDRDIDDLGTGAAVGAEKLGFSNKPLGTEAGINSHNCCFFARLSSRPPRTNATRFSNSSGVNWMGLASKGSICRSTGSIGPRRSWRSLSTPATIGL